MAVIVPWLTGRFEYVRPPGLVPYHEHIKLRAQCHISFDQIFVLDTFGLESLESLAQGLIPINGCSEGGLALFEVAKKRDVPRRWETYQSNRAWASKIETG